MPRCWTCRQRRLKCDGGLPHCSKCWGHGVKCLGYTKPLTWVEGVARRGPMKNRTFGDSQQASLMGPSPLLTATVPMRQEQHPWAASAPAYASVSVPITLTEPLFQDLSSTSKFFIDYCEHLLLSCSRCCPLTALWFRNPSVPVSSSLIAQEIAIVVSSLTSPRPW